MEDYHRQVLCSGLVSVSASTHASMQDVAAACIFLATKTEECGRKLRDVAKVYCAKLARRDAKDIPDDSRVCPIDLTFIAAF